MNPMNDREMLIVSILNLSIDKYC